MAEQHRTFLEALKKGHVVTTEFLNELSADDEMSLEEMLAGGAETFSASDYDSKMLKVAVEADLDIFERLLKEARKVDAARDPKLKALVAELVNIAKQAENEATNAEDEAQKRKVLIFSSFADTVRWVRSYPKASATSLPP